MPDDVTMQAVLPDDTGRGLAKLATRLSRPEGTLAAEAIADFVSRELATIAAIERGLAEARKGRVTPHAEVAAEARRVIAAARRRA